MNNRKVVISVGPIPARLDSVKFITNRFKGGLAMKTARYLVDAGHDITVVAWRYTEIPDDISEAVNVVRVADVFEYYDWFVAHARDYDAFVMAAAVANLTPVHPYENKFPSHNYQPGDEFDIKFMIAPRAIDVIKAINPRACLIGYKLYDAESDEELVDIARHTLKDAKANLIFANTPTDAKTRKLAITSDNAVIPCTFQEHLELMNRAICAEYYKTNIEPLTSDEQNDIDVREALALVELFEQHFVTGFGTVAIPVKRHDGWFATTARGHRGEPVIVRSVNHNTLTVTATAKATLNTPALAAMLDCDGYGHIIIHRHEDDPYSMLYSVTPYDTRTVTGRMKFWENTVTIDPQTVVLDGYTFPGTQQESCAITEILSRNTNRNTIIIPYHGYLTKVTPSGVDWTKYYEQFPEKYFDTPEVMEDCIKQLEKTFQNTLEIGGNVKPTAKFAYDPYVSPNTGATKLKLEEVISMHFDAIYIRNAINYLSPIVLREILARTDRFLANTFVKAPDYKLTDTEVSIRIKTHNGDKIRHFLWLPGDKILTHEFYAYDVSDYRALGLDINQYHPTAMLVSKGLPCCRGIISDTDENEGCTCTEN